MCQLRGALSKESSVSRPPTTMMPRAESTNLSSVPVGLTHTVSSCEGTGLAQEDSGELVCQRMVILGLGAVIGQDTHRL